MDPVTLGAIGQTVGQTASGIFGYLGQRSANKTNIRLAREGREHDVNMWNMQNAYNTPEMQMQRLKEAGLNPNLIYGDGSASTGNAGSAPSAHTASVQNELATVAQMNLMPLISAYTDWQVKKAQIDNIRSQTEGNQINNYINAFQKDYAEYNAMNQASKLLYEEGLMKENLRHKRLENQNYRAYGGKLMESQLDALNLGNRQRLLDISLDEQLKPYGMHRGDELWQRQLLPILIDMLNPIKQSLRKGGKKFVKSLF